ncbi:MAG: type I-F CRISPR-associated endoribonuclease Cas6/Csy4 [Sulfurimonas sp.]
MNYYKDIKLLDDTEISLGFIWQKVYAQMHLILVKHKDSEGMSKIGFSFPHYDEKFPLGDILRVFASAKEELELLKIEDQLKKISDYILVSDMKEVPSEIKSYVTFSRKQFKSNPVRLAKRYAKRHNVTIEEALDLYTNMSPQESQLPFIMMKSNSSDQQMRLFIKQSIKDKPLKGLFSTYGLSAMTTVPIF